MIRPILFNTEMVTAILEKRKTATRRLVKPQPERDMKYKQGILVMGGAKKDHGKFGFATREWGGRIMYAKPPALVGDILWVRETWSEWTDGYVYKAWTSPFPQPGRYPDKMMKWHPSIHMPKEAARIFLRVTDVRVERLQDMTQVDFIMEGINTCKRCSCKDLCMGLSNARICYLKSDFIKIWESTIKETDIGKYGWKANPWVWAIEFERIEMPEGWCV